ncbi:oxidoreductase [Glycomyces paridis]|uniref:SDR family NAD(P)-dependent oxidoreductase n=1 Tax=Glycomyces paridis TaxID=2126555 RepID=A0A4S8PKR2_9ACTN|nr:oxidoreductase [Glycomyces paridis]THV29059.1 SDR family NAD(P)-dependent oxidoreductase [Glycomyces paridis]
MNASRWTAADIPDQTGRTAVVTGANSGLGLATALQLAGAGARVILTVRSEAKGRSAVETIRARFPESNVEARELDLADLDSVESFAEGLRADLESIDLLVNNAGVMAPPRSLSPQGHERQFATNHLGHFALTARLMDLVEAGTEPRVVIVSSLAHRNGRIRFDDLTGAKRYSPYGFYAQSKLANALFGLELDRRLREAGSPAACVVAHPGFTHTRLVANGFNRFLSVIGGPIMILISQDADTGALPQLRAATDPEAEGGQYYGPDGRNERQGHPVLVPFSPAATDPETAKRLWTVSEELTGVPFRIDAR